ncbi:zf-HC2 domain-containing protein [Pseudidiomarina sp.]|uniref:zf-HC2 domain-containing protein n=1 Tax=Pseudidiomarina sp. TaxID=2081707 RepID=UPI003A9714CA
MSIETEKLSAFLDHELSAAEAEEVRRALETDENAAAQLAAMVMAEERLRKHIEEQNQTPIPEAITQMLSESDDKVVAGPWQKLGRMAQQHVALAASVTLVVGLSLGSWLTSHRLVGGNETLSQAVVNVLEAKVSGNTYQLNDSVTMTPQLTFQDHEGSYCRHYELYDTQAGQTTTAIQCRQNGGWKPIAEATTFHSQLQGGYQPASGRQMLDAVLDSLMSSAPLSRAAEDEVLSSHWKSDSTLEE